MDRTARAAVGMAFALAVVTGASFAFADFAVAESATTTDSQVSTSTAGNATFAPSPGVYVDVIGDDRQSADLEAAVVDALEARGAPAERAPSLRATYDRPVLFVVVDRWSLRYTPVGASATVRWHVLYVQSGNVTQFGVSEYGAGDFTADRLRERLVADRIESVTVDDWTRFVRSGEFALRDDTDGLLSLPAYDRMVRTAVANRTAEAVVSG